KSEEEVLDESGEDDEGEDSEVSVGDGEEMECVSEAAAAGQASALCASAVQPATEMRAMGLDSAKLMTQNVLSTFRRKGQTEEGTGPEKSPEPADLPVLNTTVFQTAAAEAKTAPRTSSPSTNAALKSAPQTP
ncbi:Hypothetical predicted protein, partial [Scomber scombrus]